MRTFANRAALCAVMLVLQSPLDAGEPMTARVTPTQAIAPHDVVVQVIVERNAANRSLSIEIDSGLFYQSSTAYLDGDHAPRTKEVTFRMLPAGAYDLKITLNGDAGERGFVEGRFLLF